MASTDITRLANFQKHFEDMRSLIHCKICLKPFYEPYTLPCGHTYCYSCLTSWFVGGRNRRSSKTCPDCRATVTTEPSPNFLLRDLVHMFLTHTELLPEDETIEEHTAGKEAEARALAVDRTGPGLFKGLFHRRRPPIFPPVAAIVDAEDGVQRCPLCAWELEDGECGQCGWDPEAESDDDGLVPVGLRSYTSDDDDRDISPIDEVGGIPAYAAHRHLYEYHYPDHSEAGDISEGYDDDDMSRTTYSGADSEHDDDEDNDEMGSFIDDEDDDADLPDEIDGDDESVETIPGYHESSPARQYSTDGGYTNDSDGVARDSAPPRRHFYGIDLDESSDEADNTDNTDNNRTSIGTSTQATTQDNKSVDDDSEHTNYDTDDSSVREISPPVRADGSRRIKRLRVVDSDDEDDDSEESDDTAIRPPQGLSARRQHLMGQRRRRANHTNIPERRRITASPDDPPSRQSTRRGGFNIRGRTSNSVQTARRGRPVITRVC